MFYDHLSKHRNESFTRQFFNRFFHKKITFLFLYMNFEEAAVVLRSTPMGQLKITLGNLNEFVRRILLTDYIFHGSFQEGEIKMLYAKFACDSV